MKLKFPADGSAMIALWNRLSSLPGGKMLFSKAIGRMAPYTGTIDARVCELQPGRALVQLRDRKAVRNHLNSVHAIALMNLAEVSTGLAMMSRVPAGGRGIIRGLSIEYDKKARGTLTADCTAPDVPDTTRREYVVEVDVRDAAGDVVARARATWLIGPARA